MISIVKDRPSDVILSSLNRFYDAKLSGAVTKEELATIISDIGDLFANKIKQGNVHPDEIESIETYIEGLNKNYFNLGHEGIDRASKTFLEGDYVALQELESRQIQSAPVNSYTKGFRI